MISTTFRRAAARGVLVLAVAVVASVIGWNAPAGTPVAVLLLVAAFYTLVRLLAAGALRAPRHAGPTRGRRD